MKLNATPRRNVDADQAQWERQTANAVNAIAESRMAAFYTASTAAPTTGTWAKGDKVRNSNPSELGSASSKYVIDSWICVASGTPGTWLQQRTLTGN